MYTVMGEGWCDLYKGLTLGECRAWVQGYIRSGDWGGWRWITVEDENEETVYTFAPEEE